MGKIDEKKITLPDIEMYGGNNDEWVVRLYKPDGTRYAYSELENKTCTFTLTVKDFGYVHRENGATNFTLTKSGTLDTDDEDGASAVAKFLFDTADTLSVYGKFAYQIAMVCLGSRQAAQGNLFIIKSIDQ